MTKLRKSSSSLLSLQPKLTEAREMQKTLVGNVEQRLKWAAGANPAVHEVMAAFDSSVKLLDKRLDEDQALAAVVANTCASILRHEALRTRTTEALSNDEAMLKVRFRSLSFSIRRSRNVFLFSVDRTMRGDVVLACRLRRVCLARRREFAPINDSGLCKRPKKTSKAGS